MSLSVPPTNLSARSLRTTLPWFSPICRLGLATRGDSNLDRPAVEAAIERGVNYLNWCGRADGMRDAVRGSGPLRSRLHVTVQLEARTASEARRELTGYLAELQTDYLDLVTYYYVEAAEEWDEITAPGGAAEALEEARLQGRVRAIGLTSHQRSLAARFAASGRLDMLMVRYNAAHRGAEQDVFPAARQLGLPLVAFTCLRWGELLKPTPDDPPGIDIPKAPDWYRFVLAQPEVSVALMAPANAAELLENLAILDQSLALPPQRYQELVDHGQRVRRFAKDFP